MTSETREEGIDRYTPAAIEQKWREELGLVRPP